MLTADDPIYPLRLEHFLGVLTQSWQNAPDLAIEMECPNSATEPTNGMDAIDKSVVNLAVMALLEQ